MISDPDALPSQGSSMDSSFALAPQSPLVLAESIADSQEFSPQDPELTPPIPPPLNLLNGPSLSFSIHSPPSVAPIGDMGNTGDAKGREESTSGQADLAPSFPHLFTIGGELTTETSDDVINGLLDRTVDVDDMVQAARESFHQIEMWYEDEPTPRHPVVVSAVKEMRAVAKDYVEAVKTSAKMAGHGITFAADAVSLCERLSRHSGTDLRMYIDEMRKTARLAHDEARYIYEAFSDVRRTLLQVIKRISSQTAQIEEKENSVLFRSIRKDIPYFHCIRWGRKKKHKRDRKSKQRVAALESLRSKANDIGKLDNCIGKALDWWSQAQVMLSTMESQAVSADDLKLSTVRIDTARRSWEAVLKDYLEYKTSIGTLMDFYSIDKILASSRWYKRIWKR